MKDYYKILGVQKEASEEDVKKAYRKLAHQHHPDKKGGDESKFKEINEAYQVLSNKEKRSAYDRFGTADVPPGAGFAGGGNPFAGFDFGNINVNFDGADDLGDIFGAFFEGMGVRGKRRSFEHGADLEMREEITLEDAFRGARKTVRLEMLTKCEWCEGKGYDAKKGTVKCATCGGRGEVRETRRTFFGNFEQVRECTDCFGTGEKPNEPCPICAGAGRVRGTREIAFEILPGVSDGQIIKITAGGEAGLRGTPAGDLYVRIAIKKHPVFMREESDLYATVQLSIVNALAGKGMTLRGIDGKEVKIDLPPGFNLREKFRIKGEGMPRFRSFGRGDLYVSIDAILPKKINPKARKLLEELENEL